MTVKEMTERIAPHIIGTLAYTLALALWIWWWWWATTTWLDGLTITEIVVLLPIIVILSSRANTYETLLTISSVVVMYVLINFDAILLLAALILFVNTTQYTLWFAYAPTLILLGLVYYKYRNHITHYVAIEAGTIPIQVAKALKMI